MAIMSYPHVLMLLGSAAAIVTVSVSAGSMT